MQSHFSRVRLYATPYTAAPRLSHPWDSPGKNTGVGCHFLLQCMKVKSEKWKWSRSVMCDPQEPKECSLPGSSVHGIFQARVLEWGASISQNRLKCISNEPVLPFNHFVLCHPLLLLCAIFPNISVFFNESLPGIRWPKYWSFNFIISLSNKLSELINWFDLIVVQMSRVFSNNAVQKH